MNYRLVLILHGPGIAAQPVLSAYAVELPPRRFPVAAEPLIVAFPRSDRLRSLVMAFSQGPGTAFWTAKGGRSPVDTADVDVSIPAIGWRIVGQKGSSFVSIVNADSLDSGKTALRSAGLVHHLKELIFGRPFRARNTPAKYDRGLYQGDRPFCGCTEAQTQ